MPQPAGKHGFGERKLHLDDILHGLVEDGLLTGAQSKKVHDAGGKQTGRHPLVVIAEFEFTSASPPHVPLDIERLTKWFADRVKLPYMRIDPLKIDVAAVTSVLKHSYASRFNILPVAISEDRVTVATAEPFVREWERELTRTLKRRFERVIANPLAVEKYLREFYAISRSISGAVTDRGSDPLEAGRSLEQLVELGPTGEPDANDQHVVRIVDWLLQYAFEQRASDIHLEPRRDTGNLRFRIDGVLHLVNQVPTPVMAAAISRLKAIGRMDVIERRRPQDGRIKSKTPGGKEVELRLSTMPTTFGEKLVMRIFDPDVLVKSFPELGFSEDDERRWQSMVEQPHGMIVVTGPTGSGKTTTLYSALKQLARPELNICTIEDPIELVDPQFNQMYVQHNIGLDFASGVRTVLRQDPDIIMVGEIRDEETADCAIQAALTGHLVLSTLHTNDTASTITRFLDLGIPPYQLKSALLGVVAQRLVRTLCRFCKRESVISDDEWRTLTDGVKLPRPKKIFTTGGCDECRHTGYRGRQGIYEIMLMDDDLREHVTVSTDVATLRRHALAAGMQSLRTSGARAVSRGLTTAEEVLSVVEGRLAVGPVDGRSAVGAEKRQAAGQGE
ncbi:MAG: GspE/PulE family protein [Gammaproteobacteria bacterium]|nr:GspE/PulE family protein [Gammaproteobacteria bacterium]